jgi:glutathione synthase
MSQRVLFVCDALSGFATYKDTTFAMMRECQKRGIEIHTALPTELRAAADQGHSRLQVFSHHIRIDRPDGQPWWIEHEASWKEATQFCAIIMRKDPPFNQDYFVATQLLEIAERQQVPVINSPQALRNHGEKMAALEFPEFTPPTLISSNIQSIKEFAAHHEKIVIKPLDAMGGTGVFVLSTHDPNLPSAIEVLTNSGVVSIVAQRYLPEIHLGDKRIIVIDGEPIPHVLARIPPAGQSRGNLAAGGKGVVQPISETDLKIARAVGKKLAPRGLRLIGLDIIGQHLTEINVTSPTGFQEITDQSGVDVAAIFIDAVISQQ